MSTSSGRPSSPRQELARAIERAIGLLISTQRTRARHLAEHFAPAVQPAGFALLRYILDREPVRARELATAFAIDKSAVSRQLHLLEDAELIESRRDPEDGRSTLLVSSEKARQALESLAIRSSAEYSRILSGWSTEELDAFASLLAKFGDCIRDGRARPLDSVPSPVGEAQ